METQDATALAAEEDPQETTGIGTCNTSTEAGAKTFDADRLAR